MPEERLTLEDIHQRLFKFVIFWMLRNINPLLSKTTPEQRGPLYKHMCKVVTPDSPEHCLELMKEWTPLVIELAKLQEEFGSKEFVDLILKLLELLEEARQETTLFSRSIAAELTRAMNKIPSNKMFIGVHPDLSHESNWIQL